MINCKFSITDEWFTIQLDWHLLINRWIEPQHSLVTQNWITLKTSTIIQSDSFSCIWYRLHLRMLPSRYLFLVVLSYWSSVTGHRSTSIAQFVLQQLHCQSVSCYNVQVNSWLTAISCHVVQKINHKRNDKNWMEIDRNGMNDWRMNHKLSMKQRRLEMKYNVQITIVGQPKLNVNWLNYKKNRNK